MPLWMSGYPKLLGDSDASPSIMGHVFQYIGSAAVETTSSNLGTDVYWAVLPICRRAHLCCVPGKPSPPVTIRFKFTKTCIRRLSLLNGLPGFISSLVLYQVLYPACSLYLFLLFYMPTFLTPLNLNQNKCCILASFSATAENTYLFFTYLISIYNTPSSFKV